MATRTPKEVFEHHVGALESGDIEGVLGDCGDGAVVIAPGRCRARQERNPHP
jgi:hypothetical protein